MEARARLSRAAADARRRLIRRLRAAEASLRTLVRSWWIGLSEVRRFSEERDALQHVATLMARGTSPSVIFETAASTVGCLVKADYAVINRYEADQTMSVITRWHAPGIPELGLPYGGRWPLGDDTASAAVRRSHQPARRATEALRSAIRPWHITHHIGHAVACPVIVDGRLWGTMVALFTGSEPPPADTEQRMGRFVELLNCAIVQAETHAELIASRARLVTITETTRRRVERDLHDAAQQRLISLERQLREAEAGVPLQHQELRRQLSDAARGLSNVLAELQEVSGGLYPSMLARRGLKPALRTLVSHSPVPVELHIDTDERLPEELEVTLYYVVSEALANVLKHAHASVVRIDLDQKGSTVTLTIRDDGVGGADPVRGSGLIGLRGRVGALDGTVQITSPAGKGTTLLITIHSARPAP